ncbi:MAG: ABC transporter permease [Tissierellia bacterium]|nr:ABC transporter permease [Tissierellia bacterium]
MKKGRTAVVFRHEFKNYFKNKGFIGTLIVIFLFVTIMSSLPVIGGLFKSAFADKAKAMDVGVFIAHDSVKLDELSTYFEDINLIPYENIRSMRDDVGEEKLAGALAINGLEEIKIFKKSVNYTDYKDPILDSYGEFYKTKKFGELNLDEAKISKIMKLETINTEYDVLETKSIANFGIGYVMLIAVYMLTITFGSLVATSVAREKNDRTMELLITSTNATSLINGKVFAGALASISIFIAAGLGLLVSAFINRSFMSAEMMQEMLDIGESMNTMGENFSGLSLSVAGMNIALDIKMLVVYFVFALLTYFMYLYVCAALGAIVSRIEDVNASMTPVMLLIVASFLVSIFGLVNPDTGLLRIASFIPFTSGMSMFLRVGLTSVKFSEILISFVILLSTTLLLCFFSIKLYRRGTLMYGNTGLMNALGINKRKKNIKRKK